VDLSVVVNGAHAQPPVEEHDAPEGYEDLERIDQGGFATVYRARDTRFDRTVALKVLRSDTLNDRQLRRFRAECLATGRVSSHPNIVTVYDAGTTLGHRPWLAMEYCSGGSLAHRLAAQGPLPVAEVISIGARLGSALHAAHEAGILHRDVKPHNVLLTSYGEPALADFGIASVVIEDDTVTETAAYTVVHAAPEILEGKAGTPAADIYSLGSTLYTLLAGQAPFAKEASTGLAPLVTRILRNDLPPIARPGVPPELEQLLRSCMAADPRRRPPSAAALGDALTEMGRRLEAHPRAARPTPVAAVRIETAPGPDAPQIASRRLLVILGGALAVLLALFTTWGLVQPAAEPDQPSPSTEAARAAQTAARYTPKNAVAAQGTSKGELIVTWSMPIRPDVVATVVYEGPGAARARAIVNYETSPDASPRATLRGLPSGQQVCLSVAHLVSLDGSVTNAQGRPVCAVPR
jgi:tRNA A-37 threonylcarbamoyl transferase component Bud32